MSFAVEGVAVGCFQNGGSTRITLAGGGDVVRICNLGAAPAIVLLGDSAVEVTASTGIAIMPGQVEYLTAGAATHIAGIASGQGSSIVNIATGAVT